MTYVNPSNLAARCWLHCAAFGSMTLKTCTYRSSTVTQCASGIAGAVRKCDYLQSFCCSKLGRCHRMLCAWASCLNALSWLASRTFSRRPFCERKALVGLPQMCSEDWAASDELAQLRLEVQQLRQRIEAGISRSMLDPL